MKRSTKFILLFLLVFGVTIYFLARLGVDEQTSVWIGLGIAIVVCLYVRSKFPSMPPSIPPPSPNHCSECGELIANPNWLYCPYCGTALW